MQKALWSTIISWKTLRIDRIAAAMAAKLVNTAASSLWDLLNFGGYRGTYARAVA